MKTLKTFLVTVALMALTLMPAAAQTLDLKVQTCTNLLAAASTNTFALYGDVTGNYTGETTANGRVIVCENRVVGHFTIGGFFTNSTANASNIVYKIAASVDAANWTNNIDSVTFAVPANTTNWVSQVLTISNPYPFYALRSIENVNAENISARANTLFLKGL